MITEELPSKYHKNSSIFCCSVKLLQLSRIFVNIEDKNFKIECSTMENTFVNEASRVTIERC